jgi:uncharacterized membrane protein
VAARDWVVAALAAAGTAISLYLTVLKLAGGTALFCEAGTGCDIVQASRWATFLGLPTAAWGVALYAALLVLALTGLPPARWIWAFALASAAVAFSAYLTGVSVWVLRATCPWCLIVAGIGVAILVALLVRRPAGTGKRAPTRPARVATVGIAAAIATVVFAAGVWVTDSPTAGGAFAERLARHLAATDGIMYGAFW